MSISEGSNIVANGKNGFVGGIIGKAVQNTSISACVNNGNISSNLDLNGYVGGFVGIFSNDIACVLSVSGYGSSSSILVAQ